MSKIVLVAGGTAGHVFPMLSMEKKLAENLNKNDVILITDMRGQKYVKNAYVLPISRFGFKFFLFSPYLLIKSLFIVARTEKIICFGGYSTFFPFIAAILLFKKRIIFQLDSKITRLNRLLIPFANQVLYGLPNDKASKLSAIPLRKEFTFSFIQKKQDFVITIIGGSLGSSYWKNLIIDALKKVDEKIRANLILNIQTTENTHFLNAFNLKAVQCSPFLDTGKLFHKSHLIISRAGANTIAEIARVGRPAYLVPWLGAVENHQFINAQNYSKISHAKCMPDDLADFITKLYSDDGYFESLCEKALESLPYYHNNP